MNGGALDLQLITRVEVLARDDEIKPDARGEVVALATSEHGREIALTFNAN